MSTYFLAYETVADRETGYPVLSARSTVTGKVFAVAGGETFEEAKAQLKQMVMGSIGSMVTCKENPLSILSADEFSEHMVAFNSQELFPLFLMFQRYLLGLTQAEVAERMGISQPAYAKYEDHDANPTMAAVGDRENPGAKRCHPLMGGSPSSDPELGPWAECSSL